MYDIDMSKYLPTARYPDSLWQSDKISDRITQEYVVDW